MENIEDVFDDPENIEEVESEVEAEEKKPETRGYMTKEAWTASGKNPDEWVSEEIFIERGENIKRNAALKKDFENQIKNLSLLHQLQLKQQREDLLSKRDDAIEIADKDAVRQYDKKIKDLDDIEKLSTPAKVDQSKAPEILEWEADNEWSADPADPRLKLANMVFSNAIAQGKTIAGALRMVDKEIDAKFSNKSSSPRQVVEGSRVASGKREASTPTMDTLTKEEKSIWDLGMFSDKKDFLKAVATARKEAK